MALIDTYLCLDHHAAMSSHLVHNTIDVKIIVSLNVLSQVIKSNEGACPSNTSTVI